MLRLVALLYALALASGLQSCCTRLGASRVAQFTPHAAARGAVCMCEEPEAAEAPAEEAAPVEAAAEAPKRAPRKAKGTPLEELEVGAEVTGTIRSVQSYGAFVDIGAATDALLHVSEITNEFVKDANEKLTAGETVSGRIKSINLEKQQMAMSCKEEGAENQRAPRAPRGERKQVDYSEYEAADEKEFVTGKVNSIQDYGAFITLKEGVDGLVHISQIQEGGVGKVSDVLSQGQEVQVRIVSVDKSKGRIGLSMKPWVEGAEEEQGGRRSRRDSGGPDGDDAAFQMTAEELEGLAVENDAESASPFEVAFARAALVQAAKAEKTKYARQML